jgi:hypothetical protein
VGRSVREHVGWQATNKATNMETKTSALSLRNLEATLCSPPLSFSFLVSSITHSTFHRVFSVVHYTYLLVNENSNVCPPEVSLQCTLPSLLDLSTMDKRSLIPNICDVRGLLRAGIYMCFVCTWVPCI